MAQDYYQVLGIEKTATKDDVKKAFRTLAHKYHPDKKGGDEKKFKEISEAYSVLGDDKKRAEYDAYGRTFAGGGAGQGTGFDGFDFSQFGGFNQGGFEINIDDILGGFSDIFGGGKRERRGRDISIDLELSFKDSVFGVERSVLLNKDSTCAHCTGSGAEPGSKMKTCATCNGKGAVVESQRSPFGTFSVSRTCATCNGKKQVPEKACAECRGVGVVRRQEEIRIEIPAGIDNGQVIRMGEMGEAVTNGKSGDLYIKVHVTADKRFRRDGFTILTDLSLKVTDALLGAEYAIETLDGTEKITIPPLKSLDESVRIKGKGVPHGRNMRGDMLVRLRVEFPHKLSHEARSLIEKLRGEGI